MLFAPHNKENVAYRSYHASRQDTRRRAHDDLNNDEDDSYSRFSHSARHGALPKHLQRPAFRRVATETIYAVDPDLKGIPLQFIHQKIQAAGQRLFRAATGTVAQRPKGRLPRELQVILNDVSADSPTHVFAVYSHPSALQRHRVDVFPAHALILAANCANLPAMPAFKPPRTPPFPGAALALPVVPLCIPSPPTFPLLLDYLYNRRGEHLLRALLPLPLDDDTPSLHHLARQVAESMTVSALLAYAYKTHGLWSNVAALGVSDEQLWRAMDVAWEVLRGALAIRSRDN